MLVRLKSSRALFLLAMLVLTALPVLPQDDDETIRAQRHYETGQKLYRSGRTEQAIEELYTALSVREIFFEAQLLLGRSLIETKRYREAVATLREIEPHARDTVEVQKLLGKAYCEINKLQHASRHLTHAISLSKRPDYELHYLLGLVKLRQGDARGAVDEAKIVATLKPRFALAQKLLGDACLMRQDYGQAEKALKRYLASVRDRAETVGLKERIKALENLKRAKPEKSVQKPISLPQIHKIPRPGYTAEALRYKVEGAVRVEVLFGSDGVIQHALVARGLGFGLDEEALKAARGIEFKPGEVDGKPVSMWIGVNLLFSMVEVEWEQRGNPRITLLPFHPERSLSSSSVLPGV